MKIWYYSIDFFCKRSNGVILAGNQRRFSMPWPQQLPIGEVTGTFTFKDVN
ncbi:hypothetical protein [Planktothrix agardhii]|uniref:hypothetical protein n=1 Tax=Planktothrix agardhii TaxID=1160 RepID=UPI0020A6E565|nr:hypothetical protein [Planktothrix agardhii]